MVTKVVSKEYVEEHYVEREIIESILHTLESTDNYKKENVIEDLKLALEGEKDD